MWTPKVRMAIHSVVNNWVNPKVYMPIHPVEKTWVSSKEFIWPLTPSQRPSWTPNVHMIVHQRCKDLKDSSGSLTCPNEPSEAQRVRMRVHPIANTQLNPKEFRWKFTLSQWPKWNPKVQTTIDHITKTQVNPKDLMAVHSITRTRLNPKCSYGSSLYPKDPKKSQRVDIVVHSNAMIRVNPKRFKWKFTPSQQSMWKPNVHMVGHPVAKTWVYSKGLYDSSLCLKYSSEPQRVGNYLHRNDSSEF